MSDEDAKKPPPAGSDRKLQLRIGQKARAARKKAGLTLDALSRASGVSKAMLSQIEQDKANPTVQVLYKVAMALNMSISDLVEDPEPKKLFEIIRAGHPHHVLTTNQPCQGRILSPLWSLKDLEFYEINFPEGGELDSQPHAADTSEMLAVVKGEILVVSGSREAKLLAGDSIAYSADVKHTIRNVGRGVAEIFLVVRYQEVD